VDEEACEDDLSSNIWKIAAGSIAGFIVVSAIVVGIIIMVKKGKKKAFRKKMKRSMMKDLIHTKTGGQTITPNGVEMSERS